MIICLIYAHVASRYVLFAGVCERAGVCECVWWAEPDPAPARHHDDQPAHAAQHQDTPERGNYSGCFKGSLGFYDPAIRRMVEGH